MIVSEQGLNVGRAVLWYHLVCGWYYIHFYQFIILTNN